MVMTLIWLVLSTPLLRASVIFLMAFFASLLLITACSSAAAQRLLRLLEAIQHVIHGTCPHCGQKIRSTLRRSRRTRKG